LGIQEILDEEAKGNLTDLVVRNSSGRIDDTKRTGFVKTDLQNLTEQSATGLNYDIQYSTDLSFGSLTSRLKIEQFLSYESQSSAVQPLCDWIDDEATRDYNANGNFTLDTGDFTTSLNMRFLPGYDSYDKRNTANKSCQLVGYYDVDTKNLDANGDYVDAGESQHFASYVQFDLTGAYHVNENNTVTVGIRNLFDRQPPFSSVNDWPFYSQSTYDNIGRFMYVQYDVKF
ncbi:MAG: TonB-dependent receptor, partial [Cognaticolwellia aestuarii]